jgi:hypothetical protein
MDYRDVIRSQYQASLEMLKQTIAKCPAVAPRISDFHTYKRLGRFGQSELLICGMSSGVH